MKILTAIVFLHCIVVQADPLGLPALLLDRAANPLGRHIPQLGSECNNGGNQTENAYRSRGFALVEQMKQFNRLYVEHPEKQIPPEYIDRFEKKVQDSRVYAWEVRPTWKGMPRNAGIFPDPADSSRFAIAIHRETFEEWIKLGVNFDDNVLHEYALLAEFEDDFYDVTAPIMGKLQTHPLSRSVVPASLNPTLPGRLIYFKSTEFTPNALAVYLSERDSAQMWGSLSRPQLVTWFINESASTVFTLRESPAVDWKARPDGERGFVLPDQNGDPLLSLRCSLNQQGKPQCVVWYWRINQTLPDELNEVAFKKGTLTATFSDDEIAATVFHSLDLFTRFEKEHAEPSERVATRIFQSSDGTTLSLQCSMLMDFQPVRYLCRFESELGVHGEVAPASNLHLSVLAFREQQEQLKVLGHFKSLLTEQLTQGGDDTNTIQTSERLQDLLGAFRERDLNFQVP